MSVEWCFLFRPERRPAFRLRMNCMQRKLDILVFLLWIVNPYQAQAGFDDGVNAFMRGDYRLAHAEWLPLARGGDADAARNLARLYQEGLGTARNYKEARFWYEVSAKKCNATAQNNLGLMLVNGHGGSKDPVRAFRLFQQAAIQGIHADSDAMGNLAGMYLSGSGTQTNVIEAYKWYLLYAEYTTDEANRRKLKAFLPQVENIITDTQRAEARRRAALFRPTRCRPQ